eukprot:TCONS_00061086-protein
MTLRVLLLMIFYYFQGLSSREIYVSQNEASEDIKTCGKQTHPCRTISYAISISKHNDTILLDAQYTYIQNKSLVVDKTLSFTSFPVLDNKKAVVKFSESLRDNFLFDIVCNITLNNLSIVYDAKYWTPFQIFQFNNESMMKVNGCTLNLKTEYRFTELLNVFDFFTSVIFYKTTFLNCGRISKLGLIDVTRNVSTTSSKIFKAANAHGNTFKASNVQKSITFIECLFENSILDFGYLDHRDTVHLKLVAIRSTFINS